MDNAANRSLLRRKRQIRRAYRGFHLRGDLRRVQGRPSARGGCQPQDIRDTLPARSKPRQVHIHWRSRKTQRGRCRGLCERYEHTRGEVPAERAEQSCRHDCEWCESRTKDLRWQIRYEQRVGTPHADTQSARFDCRKDAVGRTEHRLPIHIRIQS